MPETNSEAPIRVLVVDSDPSTQQLLTRILERGGYRVRAVADGEAALDEIGRELPDLMMVELTLHGGMSGFDLLDWIENTNASWLGHVILLTAASNKVIATLPEARQVCRLVRKPFDIDELIQSVASCAESVGKLPAQHSEARQ